MTIGSSDGTEAASRGFVLASGEGLPGGSIAEGSDWAGGAFRHLKAGVEETRGAYALFEESTHPGRGAPPHIHHAGEEAFFVLEGEYDFLLDDKVIHAPAGFFVLVPRGKVHAFRNVGEHMARFLVITSPNQFASYFQAVSALVGTGVGFDSAEVAELRSRYPSHVPIEWVQRNW